MRQTLFGSNRDNCFSIWIKAHRVTTLIPIANRATQAWNAFRHRVTVRVLALRRFDQISYLQVLEQRLKVMDATAISLCMDNQMPIVVFNLRTPGNIRRAVTGVREFFPEVVEMTLEGTSATQERVREIATGLLLIQQLTRGKPGNEAVHDNLRRALRCALTAQAVATRIGNAPPEQAYLLGLFANLRPIKTYDALLASSPLKEEIVSGVDILFFRELTGGLYFGESGRKPHPSGEEAFSTMTYSTEEIARIVRMAGHAARARRKKLTMVDKANVLETSRLWRSVTQRVMKAEFPDVSLEHMYIDAAAMHLLRYKQRAALPGGAS